MRPLVTPEEMAAADKAAVDSGTPVEVLMDRAGRAVARTAIRMLGGRYGKKVVVVCGKGNNGGDGYAAARVLHREGVGVRCMAVADPNELSGAARHHHELAVTAGVRVGRFMADDLDADLIIDAIYGTGLTPRPEGVPEDYFQAIQSLGYDRGDALILAVDIPSGISGRFGPIMSPVHADVTVTFGAEKVGTFLAAREFVGEVEVADIGIGRVSSKANALDPWDVARCLPHRRVDSHKRSSGSMVVLAGSDAMTGAAALVTRGAMRAGCGYVTVACTPAVAAVVHALCPEALVRTVTDADHLGPDALDALSDVLERATVVAAGPGLGTGIDQRDLVERLISEADVPLVLDADALNVLSGDAHVLAKHKERLVMTPHPAELARLIGIEAHEIQYDRIGRAEEVARRSGAVILLKGWRTVICGGSDGAIGWMPDRERDDSRDASSATRTYISSSQTFLDPMGGPELATAGTGDVLTGVVATLLAGNPRERATEAVAAAAYVHGLAGSLAVERASDTGVVAWDVAEALPHALREVEVHEKPRSARLTTRSTPP